MKAAAAQKQKAVDLSAMLPDLENNARYQNILAGLVPKEIAVRDTSRDVSGSNVLSAKYSMKLGTLTQSHNERMYSVQQTLANDQWLFGNERSGTEVTLIDPPLIIEPPKPTSWLEQLNQSWRTKEESNPFLAQVSSRQALPQTLVDAAFDAASPLIANLKGNVTLGNASYSQVFNGGRVVTAMNVANATHTIPALQTGIERWNASSAYSMAKNLGELTRGGNLGAGIGAVMAPAGTVLQYSMDDSLDMNSMQFAIDMSHNTSKGIVTGWAGGAAGVAATAAAAGLLITAPAWVPVAAGIAVGVGVAATVGSVYDWGVKGLQEIVQDGVKRW